MVWLAGWDKGEALLDHRKIRVCGQANGALSYLVFSVLENRGYC